MKHEFQKIESHFPHKYVEVNLRLEFLRHLCRIDELSHPLFGAIAIAKLADS